MSANPGRAYNPFFVHGGVGLGKTHLLQAMCLRIVESNPRASIHYTSCEGFVTHYFESVQSGELSEFRHRFRDVDVLVIDDIHFLAKRDRSQEEFFHTFNSLFQSNKQIILSSDAPPEDIPDLEERLVSRFKWGLVAKVEAPDYETRIQILKTKARLRGLQMPDDVAEYIAERLASNIRELEGAVVKLQIHSTVEKRPIDLSLAKTALGDEPRQPAGEPTIQCIIDVVTDYYAIRLAANGKDILVTSAATAAAANVDLSKLAADPNVAKILAKPNVIWAAIVILGSLIAGYLSTLELIGGGPMGILGTGGLFYALLFFIPIAAGALIFLELTNNPLTPTARLAVGAFAAGRPILLPVIGNMFLPRMMGDLMAMGGGGGFGNFLSAGRIITIAGGVLILLTHFGIIKKLG